MTPIKRNLLYIFRGSLLRLRITWNPGNTLTLSVGYKVDKEGEKGRKKWTGNRCVSNTTHGPDKTPAAIINKALETLERKIDEVFYYFEAADDIPTSQELKAGLNNTNYKKAEPLSKYYFEFLQEGANKRNWAENTYKSVKNLLPILQAFKKDITLEDMNIKTLDEFVNFMTKNKLSNKYSASRMKTQPKWKRPLKFTEKGYSNAAILKNTRILKWFIRWASSKGYVSKDLSQSFNPAIKTVDKPVIFLTWDELKRIEELDLSHDKTLDSVRDFFCFCCFTSLRYSDAFNLKKADIKESHLQLVSKKTSTNIIIDLNNHSERIINKYSKSRSIYLLPRLSISILNYHLPTIAKLAGIDEPIKISQFYGNKLVEKVFPKYQLITTHSARKTFICNALSMGIAPNIVMKWTGHSEYSAMKPYIDIVNSSRSEAMKLFNR